MIRCLEQAICYAIWSAWGYSVLKETVHLPWFMGGSTDMKTAYESTMLGQPFTKFNKSLYEWYLYSQGIYWLHLVSHLLMKEKSDTYNEFLIHHLATIALVFGSTLSNQIGIGAIISFLHMITDVPTPMAKFFASTWMETVAAVFIQSRKW